MTSSPFWSRYSVMRLGEHAACRRAGLPSPTSRPDGTVAGEHVAGPQRAVVLEVLLGVQPATATTASAAAGSPRRDAGGVAAGAEPRLADLRAQEVVGVELGARLGERGRRDDGPIAGECAVVRRGSGRRSTANIMMWPASTGKRSMLTGGDSRPHGSSVRLGWCACPHALVSCRAARVCPSPVRARRCSARRRVSRRHGVPRSRGRGGAAREGRRPRQDRRRDQVAGLGRQDPVRPRERVGHRVDGVRRARGRGQRRRSGSRRSCCRRCSRRPRWWRSTCCSPRSSRRRACPPGTSASRPRSRPHAASSTSTTSARRRHGSRRSSSGRSTVAASMEMPVLTGGVQIPEYPGDHFHYVFVEDLDGRPGQRPAGDRRPVREDARPRHASASSASGCRCSATTASGRCTPTRCDPERAVLADPGAIRSRRGTSSTPTRRRRPRATARARSCSATR